MATWLAVLGLRGRGLLAFMASHVLSFAGLARITAECGIQDNPNVDPGSLAIALTGTRVIGGAGLITLALSYWAAVPGSCMMINATQAERMNYGFRFPRGTLIAMLAAVILAVVVTMFSTMFLAYRRGAITFAGGWTYTWHPRMLYDVAVSQIRNPAGPDLPRLLWFGIGSVAMGVLIWLRSNVVGWFLHPIGFLVGHQALGVPGNPFATQFVFVGLCAWGAKSIMLKLGGVESYERSKPFFAGLVIGSVLPAFYNILINLVFGPPRM